jgi:hypothetical protein
VPAVPRPAEAGVPRLGSPFQIGRISDTFRWAIGGTDLACTHAMPRPRRFVRIVVVISGSIALACSGAGSTEGSNGAGDASGAGGGVAAAGSNSGVASGAGRGESGSGGFGASTGGSGASSASTAGGSGGSATGVGGAGTAGSSVGSSGSGSASISALGCTKDDECIVAFGHTNKGCCFRGCGSAYNRDYVASEPCVSADTMTDPVPASCDTGCVQCPSSQCQAVYGAVCFSGQCTSVTEYGPCATDSDCVVAVDYASEQGACCACAEITTKLVLANDRCVVLKGQPKPDGCVPTPAGVCSTLGCPAQCPNFPTLKCDKGVCVGN